MPYVPKLLTLFKILLRRRDQRRAEALWYEGTWLNDQGETGDARMAFRHSVLLDPEFAGARYNYAALTEKLTGRSEETLAAWDAYLEVAPSDMRQPRETVERVRGHVTGLKRELRPGEEGRKPE